VRSGSRALNCVGVGNGFDLFMLSTRSVDMSLARRFNAGIVRAQCLRRVATVEREPDSNVAMRR
jgi:hypothetical protein